MLSDMNRRRGFLLAGIHLAVAVALVSWDVDRQWHAQNSPPAARVVLAAWQETESAVPFDPCHGKGYVDYFPTPEQRTVQIDNFPLWALSGWSIPCPAPWTLAGILQFDTVHYSFGKYLLISTVFCALVPAQWFLIGAFPLLTARRWFLEPGAIITACTLISVLFIALTRMLPISETADLISTLLMAFQLLIWLYWGVLLVWKSVQWLSHRYRTAERHPSMEQ